ncbi:MAG: hypothetical protein ABEL04_06150 [Salinibacter sp.]|uniref:hypothetical protein n=1 Tax=Salinibacter sp. TaxID=2065818 RepID=UPI0035D52B27
MDVHISIVGESDRAFAGMMKLLLYSLRANGGALSDTSVTVATNAEALPADDREEIAQFGPVTFRVMPRQHGGAFTNKFNALYAPQESYEVLVYLDCDTVVFDALDEMVAGMDPDEAQFRGRKIGYPGAQSAGTVEPLIREFALPDGQTLDDVADERFPLGYPLFNGGVMVMTRPAVLQVRRDASRIAHELFARRAATAKSTLVEMLKEAARRVRNRYFSDASQSTYDYWVTEQLGVAFSILKNQIEYGLLDSRFNWVKPQTPDDGDLPALFHYMSGRHEAVDREHLFTGDWIEQYLSGASPTRHALASLAREYASAGNSS